VRAWVASLDLPLRHTFRISRSAVEVAENVLLTIEHEGLTARGEAHPADYYGESVGGVRAGLEAFTRWLAEGGARRILEVAAAMGEAGEYLGAAEAVERFLAGLPREARRHRSALAAIDIALHDLAGQLAGRPVWALLGAEPARAPATSFTIAIASLEEMLGYVAEAERYPILKIKLGTGRDAEVVRAIRRHGQGPEARRERGVVGPGGDRGLALASRLPDRVGRATSAARRPRGPQRSGRGGRGPGVRGRKLRGSRGRRGPGWGG